MVECGAKTSITISFSFFVKYITAMEYSAMASKVTKWRKTNKDKYKVLYDVI